MSLWDVNKLMVYNIDYDVAGLFVAILLHVFLSLKYPKDSRTIMLLKKAIRYVIYAVISDIVSVMCITFPEYFPYWLKLISTDLYYILATAMSYVYLEYICTVLLHRSAKRVYVMIGRGAICVLVCACVLQLFTNCLFYFDETGRLQTGTFYAIVFIVPFYFVAYAGIRLFIHRKEIEHHKLISGMLYAIVSMMALITQIIWVPDTYITMFAVVLLSIIMIFSIETPDYVKLTQTMEELKEARKQAEAANRAKTYFLASMSHEIRTPINAVLGFNEMILRESSESNIKSYAADANAAAKSLYRIINDILDFAKIETGKFEIVCAEYDFAALINSLYISVKDRAEKKKLELAFNISPEVPSKLMGDDVRIRQILTNILTNGIKYTEKGKVTFNVLCRVVENKAILGFVVTDTGSGISIEDQKRLFVAFDRLDEKKVRYIEGTGLGLSITNQVLRLMGGELMVESEVGKGSAFYFELEQEIIDHKPIGECMWGKNAEEADYKYETKLENVSGDVLIIDDNLINIKVFKALLKKTGLTVDEAYSGAEGIEKVRNKKYSIIFVDHMMPELDGVETLKRMKAMNDNMSSQAHYVALTANALSGAREYYISVGFDAFLSKPIISKDLEKLIYDYMIQEDL